MITQRKQSKIYVLAECAILVALGTVLSLLKLVDLPYGGSVTVASMLPLLIISYRHGMVWGLGCGLVYGAIQQLLGLNTLSYFSTFGSILAVILLDYIVAFAVVGLGGMFRKAVRNESVALAGGALVTGLLRYLCHVISGATVWAGISIPTKAAIGYSLIYNATYMIPETLVLMLVAFYLGQCVDLTQPIPRRIVRTGSAIGSVLHLGALGAFCRTDFRYCKGLFGVAGSRKRGIQHYRADRSREQILYHADRGQCRMHRVFSGDHDPFKEDRAHREDRRIRVLLPNRKNGKKKGCHRSCDSLSCKRGEEDGNLSFGRGRGLCPFAV